MLERYARILDTCQPFVVAHRHRQVGDWIPVLERPVPRGHRFDPQRVDSAPFLSILQRLDAAAFDAIGMSMPRWVFYDCAEVPGGIFGFARPAKELQDWVRSGLGVPDDYDGPVPLSMYVSVPMLEPGAWHNYTLCSLNEVAPGAGPANLRLVTGVGGLSAFGVRKAYGATQWRSPKLAVHARFGPLELATAWTPAHSDPRTLTYRFPVDEDRLRAALALGELAPPTDGVFWVDCDDDGALQALQARIESGARIELVGAPVVEGSFTRAPLREVQS